MQSPIMAMSAMPRKTARTMTASVFPRLEDPCIIAMTTSEHSHHTAIIDKAIAGIPVDDRCSWQIANSVGSCIAVVEGR